jgi:hypothetical protein
VVVAALLNVAHWHPYPIAAYNQIFGGAPMGARVFRVGWGEGLDQAAAWLDQQPDITYVHVVSPRNPTFPLHHYLRYGASVIFSDTLPDKAGYVVLYIRNLQGAALKGPFRQLWEQGKPLHVVRIHGVEYAWIYQAPPPLAQELPVDFGDAIHLRGFTLDGERPLRLTLQWQARDKPSADYMLFAHLIGTDNKRYAQVDVPIPTSTWLPDRYVASQVTLPVPPDVPAGKYRLLIGLYETTSGKRVSLGAKAAAPQLAGADALLLADVDLR